MKKKGFTLVEVLVVITIISILVVIAIPASQRINKKVSQNMLNSKIALATEGAKVWGEDHVNCFLSKLSCPEIACNDDLSTEDERVCMITMGSLAESKYFKYDKDKDGQQIIEDPTKAKPNLNDELITIIYYNKTNTVITYHGEYTGFYNLTFNGNGIDKIIEQKCYKKIPCSLSLLEEFKRDSHDLLGWGESSEGNVKYKVTDSLKLTAPLTLYAIWGLKEYALSFNSNDGTGDMEPKKCKYETQCDIPDNKFINEGNNFIGWSTSENGEKEYDNLGIITINRDTTLYAKWQDVTPPTILITNTSTLLPGTDIYSGPATIQINVTDKSGVKAIKYCTTTSSTCTPANNISNGGIISVNGRMTTTLGDTICSVATDNLNNTTTPKCETYKIDNLNPSMTCASTGDWSKTSSTVNCTGKDHFGIRKLEWSVDNNNWNTFSNINESGPFSTPYTSSFITSSYNNYVKVTDTAGRTYTRKTYSKIDKAPPIAITVDIKGTLSDSSNNVSNIVCTNNEYLADDSMNPDYEMYANNECTVYTRKDNPWQISWDWNDDWASTDNSGYSDVDYLTYNGSCSSSYYTGGRISCMDARTGRSIYMYAVDAAGNKGIYYFKMTIR